MCSVRSAASGIIIGVAIAISAIGPGTAQADPGPTLSPDMQDQLFTSSLEHFGLLFNFPLERDQAQRACQQLRNGSDERSVIDDLVQKGSYSYDVASRIVIAGEGSYCIDVGAPR
ncbi:DUF732 domain-containing protein [Mycobacterium sp. TY815]|uniref:DUF732 domain-containing protein n=1 Tax=Mycobacterium sp. TY815 TaxID=3050581 RepID=UPI0027417E2B|nr:DUF732 domain-containing protein [Mycobacterium sp. TY815]MDP7707405.1 DUF732 domain-containing protein [Mycobacterium sp. TY815]